jgi:hypothetical protein
VLANSPFAYKTFSDAFSNSPYAKSALKLQVAPKAVPLMQFTHLAKQSPNFKPANIGNTHALGISNGNLGAQAHMPVPSKIVTLPAKGVNANNPINGDINNGKVGKTTGLPGKINSMPINAGKNSGNIGKVTSLPPRVHNHPIRVSKPVMTSRPMTAPRHFSSRMGGGGFSQRFAGPSRSSFGGGFGRGFGGGFGRR